MEKTVPPQVDSRVNGRNADFDWDSFDSEAYFAHNYSELRPEDRRIIEIMAGHFNRIRPRVRNAEAIDVGAGANLYPALAMLPFAGTVTLYERARSNVRWLEQERRSPQDSWSRFWSAMSEGNAAYAEVVKPLAALEGQTRVEQGDIFRLPAGRYDLGTMFFVAESITRTRSEFTRATKSFVDSLRPKAPFAAAFMRESAGYTVGGHSFPAYAVDEQEVARLFQKIAHHLEIQVIDSSGLRPGYCGMIVVTGRAGTTNTTRRGDKR
ncbi:MAG: SCO2525 family SAM-dependent methyltransferase [Actinoplanes sp.]